MKRISGVMYNPLDEEFKGADTILLRMSDLSQLTHLLQGVQYSLMENSPVKAHVKVDEVIRYLHKDYSNTRFTVDEEIE